MRPPTRSPLLLALALVTTAARADDPTARPLPPLPEAALAPLRAGMEKLRAGDLDAARAEFDAVIRAAPDHYAGYQFRSDVWRSKGDSDRALADLDKAIALAPPIRQDPRFAVLYHSRGQAWEAKGRADRAIADYTQAIEHGPADDHRTAGGPPPFRAFALWSRAGCRLRGGDRERALKDLDEAIRLAPTEPTFYGARAGAWGPDRIDAAIADLTEQIRLLPEAERGPRALAHSERGNLRERKRDRDGALADYTEAIRLAPEVGVYRAFRAELYRAERKVDAAIADYTEEIRLAPRDPAAYEHRAIARMDKPDLDGAIADLDEAIRLAPKHADYYSERAVLWSAKGDRQRADRDQEEADRLAREAKRSQ